MGWGWITVTSTVSKPWTLFLSSTTTLTGTLVPGVENAYDAEHDEVPVAPMFAPAKLNVQLMGGVAFVTVALAPQAWPTATGSGPADS